MLSQGAPLLTIATVVKDDQYGLARTLASLAGVQSPHVEVLVVDGSVNAQAVSDALTGLSGVATRYVWSAPAGVYPAMNEALELAAGEYVWFINAGDALHSTGAIDDVRSVLQPRPAWAVGRVCFIDARGGTVSPPAFDYASHARSGFSRGVFPPHQGTIVRTELARRVGGFDTRFRIAADYALALRLSQVGVPAMSDGVWADFHEGGLSTQNWRAALAEFHVARRTVLRPEGWGSLAEYGWTAQQYVAQGLYRTLLAPGRPLGGVWQRLRPYESSALSRGVSRGPSP